MGPQAARVLLRGLMRWCDPRFLVRLEAVDLWLHAPLAAEQTPRLERISWAARSLYRALTRRRLLDQLSWLARAQFHRQLGSVRWCVARHRHCVLCATSFCAVVKARHVRKTQEVRPLVRVLVRIRHVGEGGETKRGSEIAEESCLKVLNVRVELDICGAIFGAVWWRQGGYGAMSCYLFGRPFIP